jgi:hypothetical protein
MLFRLIPFIALIFIPSAAAAHPLEGKYACLNEIAVGIEQKADGSIVQGKFEYRPEKFILSVEMGLLNGLEASVNPAVGHRYFQEKDVHLPIDDHVSLTATGGHGWLILNATPGTPRDLTFRLGYLYGGSEFLLRGRCSALPAG